jgi:hypothetical protein
VAFLPAKMTDEAKTENYAPPHFSHTAIKKSPALKIKAGEILKY